MTTQGNFYKYTVDQKKTNISTETHSDSWFYIKFKGRKDDAIISEVKTGMKNTDSVGKPKPG